MIAELAEWVWYADGAAGRVARALLAPVSVLFERAATHRARGYDRGERASVAGPVPTISVGNLTVGGTGKTPFTALLVRTLRSMGRTPAVVMRGYGGDEPILHEWLSPGVRVYADADRVRAIRQAAADGADAVVLDDAFQHRRAARDLDIVLVSVDRWRGRMRLLPAGPLREPLAALERAGVIALTVKRAPLRDVECVRAAVQGIAPGVPVIVVQFGLDAVRAASHAEAARPVSVLDSADVLAIAGIGDPASYFTQLERVGARVTRASFGDHHAYTRRDAVRLARIGAGHKYVVATAKDVVKLSRLWPANAPGLWYVSQAVTVSDGASLLDAALRRALARRPPQTVAYGHRPPPVNT